MEDGLNAGSRSIGRLALALIPWALGIGASVWFGVYVGVHQFRHELSQEDRSALYTSALDKPKSKIEIAVLPHDCTKVTRVDFDGNLVMYAKNNCANVLDYLEWHWQELSPNNIVINQGYTNSCPIPAVVGSEAECVLPDYRQPPDDERTAKLQVWTDSKP